MWLLVMGPLLTGLWLLAAGIDWPAVATAAQGNGSSAEIFERISSATPDLGVKIGIAVAALGWAMLIAFLLYPVFQAMVLRWWASGLRFGELSMTSRLRAGKVYGAYARFFGLALAYSLVLGTFMGMVFGLVGVTLDAANTDIKEIATAGVGLVSYVLFMLGSSAIYQVTVRLALWRLVVESLDIASLSALDRVTAQGQPSSPFGEGLADALNVGGL
jgi:uncharacterized membrane protein YjgN (DUF898 family)